MMPSRVPEMINLFSKFRIMGPKEIQTLVGTKMSRVQANRYIRTLIKFGLVHRRVHPRLPVFGFEATEKLLEYSIPEKAIAFRAQRDQDLLHRLRCTRVLTHLCKREYVSGVAIEHELSPEELAHFCYGRTPDGIIQTTKPGRNSIEIALEVELETKGEPRIDELLSLYEKTLLSGEYLCKGLIVVTPSEFCRSTYQRLIEKRPPDFRERVRVSTHFDLSDLDAEVFGPSLESAYLNRFNSCFSKRLANQKTIKYLNDFSGNAHIRAHRGETSRPTDTRRQDND